VSTIVIGDVHGCLDELRELVRRCAVPVGPRVVLVGDLVAKGPDSAGVVQWAREGGVRAVLGNHDAHVLRLGPGAPNDDDASGAKSAKAPKADHVAVAQALAPAEWAWLEARPLWLHLDGREQHDEDDEDPHAQHLVVHGGLVPGVALEDQKREHLLNMRSIKPDGAPSKRIEGVPWGSRWRGPPHVAFGHDAVRGLQRHPWATGLDTGCVYGKELTALILPDHKLVSVPARRAYSPMK
jgi:hypothetical protein